MMPNQNLEHTSSACRHSFLSTGSNNKQQVCPQCHQQENHTASRLSVPPGDAVPAQSQTLLLSESSTMVTRLVNQAVDRGRFVLCELVR